MDTETKKLADNKDLKSLKYIFVDSLDVDPTFVRYEEEYNYCKSIPGLLEQHIELTPFTYNKVEWNEYYWTKLKMDLIKNFSNRRMMHMKEVAQVFLVEKVQRILAERATKSMVIRSEPSKTVVTHVPTPRTEVPSHIQVSKSEQQEREILAEKERLAREYNEDLAKEQAEEAKRIAQQRAKNQNANSMESGGTDSKKMIGVVIAAVAVIAVVAVILILK